MEKVLKVFPNILSIRELPLYGVRCINNGKEYHIFRKCMEGGEPEEIFTVIEKNEYFLLKCKNTEEFPLEYEKECIGIDFVYDETKLYARIYGEMGQTQLVDEEGMILQEYE